MNIHLEGDLLIIQNANQAEYERIKCWNLTRWNRKSKQIEGPANLELLDKLADLTPLPSDVEAQLYFA